MLGKRNKGVSLGQMAAVSRFPKDHFLRVIDEKVDWKPSERELERLCPSRRGRPSYLPWMMFKALLLQNWYKFSDPGLEEAIRDRISFQWFLGLSFTDRVPNETTVWRFRGLLRGHGIEKGLFDRCWLGGGQWQGRWGSGGAHDGGSGN